MGTLKYSEYFDQVTRRRSMREMKLIAIVLMSALVSGDIYMHVPRGSNNRIREQSAERNNANRVFDSQNNNRGGYNVGDKTDQASGNNEENQYRMKYFQSGNNAAGKSLLNIEWTNQHGCGGNEDTDPNKLNCNMVIQYMCQDDVAQANGGNNGNNNLRNGVNTNTQNYQNANPNETKRQFENRRANGARNDRALHDSFEWYDKCSQRNRNKGL